MAKTYTGNLSLEWYNKHFSVLLQKQGDSIQSANDIPAPKINWINKEDALFYDISDVDGKGFTPFWVDSNDIRVKEARPLILQKVFKAVSKDTAGTLPGTAQVYHVEETKKEDDLVENILIKGDNLITLNTLKKHFGNVKENMVKCIFIDPPYNTLSSFIQYEDNLAHSEWLTLMRDRLVVLRSLLSNDGTIWITIDDQEGHYLKVLCDETFGRDCYVTTIIWRSTDNSNNDAKQFSNDYNMILVYSKSPGWVSKKVEATPDQIGHYKNPDNDPKGAWFDGNPISSPNYRENLVYDIKSPNGHIIKAPSLGWRWSRETMNEKIASGEIRFTEDGKNIRRRTYLADHKGLPPSNLWIDIEETGHNRQAKYEQKKLIPNSSKEDWFETPKPEKLLQKILHLASEEGDFVLDCFGGSGTTYAVAQKMKRRWIGIEIGGHIDTHIIPRLNKVLIGKDNVGISEEVNWQGGGAYKYYHLGPSIIKINKDGTGDFNWSLGKKFIEESFLLSYDYTIDNTIDLAEDKLFSDKANLPVIGVQKIGSKNRVAIVSLNEPQGKLSNITYGELQSLYKTVKKKFAPEYINIFTNRGIEIAYDSKPEDLEVIKVPSAIFAELEK